MGPPGSSPAALSVADLIAQVVRCAARVVVLLARRCLHVDWGRVGQVVRLPDGRRFLVFRETRCDRPPGGEPVTLAVWFRLRAVPPGSRLRRWAFERESLLNTVLYAGCDGYHVKLWMVDPQTSGYAGLYEWIGREEAERYGRYISSVLAPLSVPGSVGYELVPATPLARYLEGAGRAEGGAAAGRPVPEGPQG